MRKKMVTSTVINGLNLRVTRAKNKRDYVLILVNTSKRFRFGLTPGGKREVGFPTKKDALEAFRGTKEAIISLEREDAYHPTVKEVVLGFSAGDKQEPGWKESRQSELRKTTFSGYMRTFNRFIALFGKRQIRDIEALEIRKLLKKWQDGGIGFTTIKNHKARLCNLFGYAVEQGYLQTNPVRSFTLKKPALNDLDKNDVDGALETVGDHRFLKDPPNPFTRPERDRFMEIWRTERPHYYALVATGFMTGLRPGELLAMPVKCVDFKNRELKVRLSYTLGDLGPVKTDGSFREVPMDDFLYGVLRTQLAYLKTLELKLGRKIKLMFPNQAGNFINLRNWSGRTWLYCLKKAGVAHHTPYNLRHTFASLKLAGGTSIHKVAKLLGHSSVDVTFRHYYKYMPKTVAFGSAEPETAPAPIPDDSPQLESSEQKKAERVAARPARNRNHLRLVVNQ